MQLRVKSKKGGPVGYGNHHGHTTETVYYCPCGKGEIFYENDDIPGFKNRKWDILCPQCKGKYEVKNGEIVEKKGSL